MAELVFPEGFVWGAATAAFQIEGANEADGRLPSIWDEFCRVPGAVANGDDGSVACDHYHRYPQDVALLADLGLPNYRFSTSWARIMPDGITVNPAGLDFYDRLVDELLAHHIDPWLTLYHWDLPAAIEGGWLQRDVADKFARYAQVTFERLGDRVKQWTTLNEPWCCSFLSYACGEHAPGHTDPVEAVTAAHHLLLAHGRGLAAMRELAGPDHQLGITLNFTWPHPADPDNPGDLDAARRIEGAHNRVFLDPLFRGEYPADVIADMAEAGLGQAAQEGDFELISAPVDFLGVNFYNGVGVAAIDPTKPVQLTSPGGLPRRSPYVGSEQVVDVPRGLPLTDMGWEVNADDLRDLLVWLHQNYTGQAGIPLVITENGAAYDTPVIEGQVNDTERVEYFREHLTAVHQAIESGADVAGYFAWSLLDNFEWSFGYDRRFGIVHVDYDTQVRTPKASAHLLGQVARTNVLG